MPMSDDRAALSRRRLLHRSWHATLAVAATACTGSGTLPTDPDDTGSSSGPGGGSGTDSGPDDDTGGSDNCPDPLADAEFIEVLGFEDEPERDLEELSGTGLDARYVHDLSTVETATLITPTERFFIRTAAPEGLDSSGDWSVTIHGKVGSELTLDISEIRDRVSDQGVVLMECSGNTSYGGYGLLSAASWTGVRLADLLDGVDVQGEYLRVEGLDEHPPPTGTSEEGADWIFRLDDLLDAGAFLATEMNGEPLTDDHGAPVRLVVPGWYGCCATKWVQGLKIVGADEDATSQMKEFASRTHQSGTPSKASDYKPAIVDPTAVPVRVEHWQLDGEDVYRIVGLTWGGPAIPDTLLLLIGDEEGAPVEICPSRTSSLTWALWTYIWRPTSTGDHVLSLEVDDSSIETRRLDSGWYTRTVRI